MSLDLLLLSGKMGSIRELRNLLSVVFGLALFSFGGAAGCTRLDSDPTTGALQNSGALEGGTLEDRLNAVIRVHLTSDPVTLDPWLAEDGVSLKVLNNVMQGLVEYGLDGQIQPALAEEWKVSKDGLKWEFTLRPQVRWSDGRPVRTDEFVAGFRHALSPATPSKLAPLLINIKNAAAIRARTKPLSDLGVLASADDPRKLTILLEKPQPWFIHALTLPVAFPLRGEILRGNSGRWPDTAPVTGRYRIVERRLDRSIRLEPNPNHWSNDPSKPQSNLRSIVLQVIQDDSTALNLFERGDLDVLSRIPALELDRIKRRFRVVHDPFFGTFFLGFNLNKAPFQDREVRRAVSAAINRQEIVKHLSGSELPSFSWIPAGIEGGPSEEEVENIRADSKKALEIPPVLAKALQAVKARGAGSAELVDFAFDSSSRNQLVAEKIQQDVQKKLALNLSLKPSDWKTHVRQLGTDPAPLWRFGWMAPFRDPISHFQAFTSGDPNNYAHYSNPSYDRLVSEISSLPPGSKREELIRQAQRILTEEDAVIIPLFQSVQTHALGERLEGFQVSPFGIIRFDQLSIREGAAN